MSTTIFYLILILTGIIIILFLLWRRNSRLLSDAKFSHRSLASKYGKMTEQFMPFLADYPYDPQNFRFLGTPIDGVQFNDDEIIFLEFKAAAGGLTDHQKRARDLVEKKKVRWEERRIE